MKISKKPTLKILRPTLRQKKRFILFKVTSPDHSFSTHELIKTINKHFIDYLGILEYGDANIQWINYKKLLTHLPSHFIVRCNTKQHKKLIGILALIHEHNRIPLTLTTIKVSGTLLGLSQQTS